MVAFFLLELGRQTFDPDLPKLRAALFVSAVSIPPLVGGGAELAASSSAEAREPSVEMFSINRPAGGCLTGCSERGRGSMGIPGEAGEAGETGVGSSGIVVGAWIESASAVLLSSESRDMVVSVGARLEFQLSMVV